MSCIKIYSISKSTQSNCCISVHVFPPNGFYLQTLFITTDVIECQFWSTAGLVNKCFCLCVLRWLRLYFCLENKDLFIEKCVTCNHACALM